MLFNEDFCFSGEEINQFGMEENKKKNQEKRGLTILLYNFVENALS